MVAENKNQKKDSNSNIIKIIIGIIVVGIVAIIITMISRTKSNNEGNLEKIAAKKYFENGFISVNELYIKAGNSDIDEVQTMQLSLKRALDSYFASSNERTVKAETILGMIENPYGYRIDLNGMLVSGYTYSPENDTFTVEEEANTRMAVIENTASAKINENDNKKIMVQNIEKTGDNTYKIIANIGFDKNSVNDKAEMIIKIDGEEIVLESAKILDK